MILLPLLLIIIYKLSYIIGYKESIDEIKFNQLSTWIWITIRIVIVTVVYSIVVSIAIIIWRKTYKIRKILHKLLRFTLNLLRQIPIFLSKHKIWVIYTIVSLFVWDMKIENEYIHSLLVSSEDNLISKGIGKVLENILGSIK
jgi:ABC-type amino acid transport system permease subunit